MNDSALAAPESEQLEPELAAVLLQLPHLVRSAFTGNEQILEGSDGRRGRRMIERRQGQVRTAHGKPFLPQQRECLRRRDFVDDVQVDVEYGRRLPRLGNDHVVRPYLVEQGRWCTHGCTS